MSSRMMAAKLVEDLLEDEDGDVKHELETLRIEYDQLYAEKRELEEEFGRKRAKLRELYMQKEDELRTAITEREKSEAAVRSSERKCVQLETELNDVRAATELSQQTQQAELEIVQNKYEHEMASLNHIMRDQITESQKQIALRFEDQINQLQEANLKLQTELEQAKKSMSQQRESFLTSVAKRLQIPTLPSTPERDQTSPNRSEPKPPQNLEDSMKQAQADCEMLRCVVVPLEEEINSLQEQLAAANARLRDAMHDRDELASRLNMNTSNALEQLENSTDVSEVAVDEPPLLSRAKSQQELETHVHVLSTQQKALKQDSDRVRSELVTAVREQERLRRELRQLRDGCVSSSHTSLRLQRELTAWQVAVKSLSAEQQHDVTELMKKHYAQITADVNDKEKETVEVETNKQRLVSEREWNAAMTEMDTLRARVLAPCAECAEAAENGNTLRSQLEESEEKALSLDKSLKWTRSQLSKQENEAKELEKSYTHVVEQLTKQVVSLESALQVCQDAVEASEQQAALNAQQLMQQLQRLQNGRGRVNAELVKLQETNDQLVGKTQKTAQELQAESINLPDTVQELQEVVLHYRDDLIKAKVALDHSSDERSSQVLFLKNQLTAEQQEKQKIEETLSTEITQLQETIAIKSSMESEMEREKKVRQEAETKISQLEEELKRAKIKSHQWVQGMKAEGKKAQDKIVELEKDRAHDKSRISSLQVDLDNMEATQRDFVKLSQSLQIQLEKIRSSEDTVRWQHEEDVAECGDCKKNFNKALKKRHCRHCGKIYCYDCTSKSVLSGASQQPSHVCNVCHTILIPHAQPYFSVEPPQSPD